MMMHSTPMTLFLVRFLQGLALLLWLTTCADIHRSPAPQTDTDELHEPNAAQAPQPLNKVENHTAPASAEATALAHPVHMKKREFFRFMKPIIAAENARILANRQRVLKLKASQHLQQPAINWLSQMAREYRVPFHGRPAKGFWYQLLTRMDVVPLEMAMAQAANESAWGNSRFAREANNYFGQWCFRAGCGLVPLQRNAGAHHEVRYFDSPALSVRAYLRNMNTHRVYQSFRKLRRSMRHQRKPLDAEFLALGLKHYSERGAAYVKTIRSIIRKNKVLMQQI